MSSVNHSLSSNCEVLDSPARFNVTEAAVFTPKITIGERFQRCVGKSSPLRLADQNGHLIRFHIRYNSPLYWLETLHHSSYSSDSRMNSDLRILCLNDVYKPERFSMLKTLRGIHKGTGVTKLGTLPSAFVLFCHIKSHILLAAVVSILCTSI